MTPVNLRVKSDGTPRGTVVTIASTGEMVHGVTAVTWDCAIGEGNATLRMEVRGVEIDAEGLPAAVEQDFKLLEEGLSPAKGFYKDAKR